MVVSEGNVTAAADPLNVAKAASAAASKDFCMTTSQARMSGRCHYALPQDVLGGLEICVVVDRHRGSVRTPSDSPAYSTVPGCGFTRTNGIGTVMSSAADASITDALQNTADCVDSILTSPELI